jgi:hypothetical protein
LELQNLQLAVLYSESLPVPERKRFFNEFFKFFRFGSGMQWWPFQETGDDEEDVDDVDEEEYDDDDESYDQPQAARNLGVPFNIRNEVLASHQYAPSDDGTSASTRSASIQANAGSVAPSVMSKASASDLAKLALRNNLRQRYLDTFQSM